MTTSLMTTSMGKRTYKIIFLGESGTGKTSIIQRFVNNKFQEKQNPTVGIDFLGRNLTYKGATCRLQLWDTAGQQRFKSLIPTYLKDAICAVFVFDVSKPQTLNKIQEWIDLYRENKGDKTVSIFCGNKSDLEVQFERKTLQKLMQKHKIPYHPVSAKTGHNIQQLFNTILDQINYLHQARQKKFQKKYEQENEQPPLTKQTLTGHISRDDLSSKASDKLKLDKNDQKYKCCCW